MAVNDIITDPSLLPVLKASSETLTQCQNLLGLLDPTALTSPLPQETVLNISKQQKLVFALLSQLRGLNREAILNNLYYEQRHLSGESPACESYDHPYTSLPLIPVQEFLAIYPEHANSNDNELMIARINHEHAEREKLEQARQELLKRKQALIAENKKRKDDLASLDLDLERFIDAAKPIQKLFEKEYAVASRKTSVDEK
ncbi:hypothetical protein CIHG_01725 [Coccidioides immitis H538.4]|uniref:Fms interacting protein n=1 Tax=Coccidioides immitis H538.4 TaxID=396776 RepID=A0A0J8RH11_COCIT|nr:hypothetical protein CIHG_01725 [Coccidioides immitis H538.4]